MYFEFWLRMLIMDAVLTKTYLGTQIPTPEAGAHSLTVEAYYYGCLVCKLDPAGG